MIVRRPRSRRLIQLGGVMVAWDMESAERSEKLTRTITNYEGWREWLTEQEACRTPKLGVR